MKYLSIISWIAIPIFLFSSTANGQNSGMCSLTVEVKELRNSVGLVQFSLYNTDGSIPDEHFNKYYKQVTAKINGKSAMVTFKNLPKGTYAINILHDEDKDGQVTRGLFLPIEGLGFSNFTKLNPLNRPNYKKAKFYLGSDKTIQVKMIYM